MKYEVTYGDLTIRIDQWNADGTLNQVITLHASETRNGIEFPFRYRSRIERYGF